jgi:hypothetical protein
VCSSDLGDELNIVFAALPEQGKELVKEERGRDHGWPGIMTEAILLKDLRPAAKVGTAVNQGHGATFRPEAECCRDASEAAADDDRLMI